MEQALDSLDETERLHSLSWLPVSLSNTPGQSDVAKMEHRKWMSFGVEHPTIQGQQIIAGEQQI